MNGPILPRLDRLEDHQHPRAVRRPADDHAADRQHPPVGQRGDDEDHRDPEQEAEEEAEVDHQPQLPAADVLEDPVGELRMRLDVADHHQLHVEELIDVVGDLVGDDLLDDLGQLLPGRGPGRASRTRGGRSCQSCGCSRSMIRSTTSRMSPRAEAEDVLGDLLGLELLVEVARGPELGDPLVDRDRAHLRGAGGDDPLPADAAVHDPRDLLEPARQQPGERAQAGDAEADEADRVEEHPDPGPVDHVADRAREHRDRDLFEQLAVHRVRGAPGGQP